MKKNQFKNKNSFLSEGQILSSGKSETDILPKQILCLQGREGILLISLLKKWDSAKGISSLDESSVSSQKNTSLIGSWQINFVLVGKN